MDSVEMGRWFLVDMPSDRAAPNFALIPKLIVLAVIAVACYVVYMIRFQKKDLPL